MIRGNLLVVEDESNLRGQLANLLSQKGANVLMAENGREALNLLESRKISYGSSHVGLILSDLKMPEGDGISLLAGIRTRFANEEIPFVLMSGDITLDQIKDVLKMDADGVLIKPFQVFSLMEKLEDALKIREKKMRDRRMAKLKAKIAK